MISFFDLLPIVPIAVTLFVAEPDTASGLERDV